MRADLRRRSVLAAAAMTVPLVAAGCKGVGGLGTLPKAAPDVAVLRHAIATEQALIARYHVGPGRVAGTGGHARAAARPAPRASGPADVDADRPGHSRRHPAAIGLRHGGRRGGRGRRRSPRSRRPRPTRPAPWSGGWPWLPRPSPSCWRASRPPRPATPCCCARTGRPDDRGTGSAARVASRAVGQHGVGQHPISQHGISQHGAGSRGAAVRARRGERRRLRLRRGRRATGRHRPGPGPAGLDSASDGPGPAGSHADLARGQAGGRAGRLPAAFPGARHRAPRSRSRATWRTRSPRPTSASSRWTTRGCGPGGPGRRRPARCARRPGWAGPRPFPG